MADDISLSNALSFVFYVVFLIALCLWRIMLSQRKDLFRPFPLWEYGQAELHIGNINTREEIGMAQREVAPCFWDEKSKLQWLVFSIFSKQVRSTAKELFDFFFLFAKIPSFRRTQRENWPFVQDAPLQSPKQPFSFERWQGYCFFADIEKNDVSCNLLFCLFVSFASP